MECGIYTLKDAEYFALDMPSSSTTKVFLTKTNAHAAHERENPTDSDAFTLGALVHALVLTPHTIDTDFIRVGKVDRRTTAGKAEWESAVKRAALASARIVSDDQFTLASAMASAVMTFPAWARLSEMISQREVAIIGNIGGAPSKCKVDGASDDFTIIVDIKTCQSAAPREFARACAQFQYHYQAAFYRAVAGSVGKTVKDFVFVCVEKDSPHCVAVYRLADRAIDEAEKLIIPAVRRWGLVKHGSTEGYPTFIQDLDLPEWAYEKQETP